ncbi:MAG: phosphonate ABC transporter, permease protein PhnE [Chloroflexota bacterium]
MTTAPASGVRVARPPRPRRSPFGIAALLVGVAITVWCVLPPPIGIGFDLAKIAANWARGREILSELFSPNLAFFPQTVRPLIETFQMAVVACVIGCAVALPLAFLASRVTSPGRWVLWADRSVLNVLRALPDLLYAVVFVAAVGVGPLPGVLALILFNIGVVAKLLSETVDAVDTGPIEAAWAVGATRTQMVRSAAMPQVMPNYVAFALYTFELNIRASTVLGIVGAGGIGTTLNTQMRAFNFENVGLIVLELFVFVLLIELVSVTLRRRLV